MAAKKREHRAGFVTERVREGLREVRRLVRDDIASDPDRWPADHPIHDALDYINAHVSSPRMPAESET